MKKTRKTSCKSKDLAKEVESEILEKEKDLVKIIKT